MTKKEWTEDEIRAFNERYSRTKQEGPGRKRVRVTNRMTGEEHDFDSISACAAFYKVGISTVSRWITGGCKDGELDFSTF